MNSVIGRECHSLAMSGRLERADVSSSSGDISADLDLLAS
jgi:hypothetical protein